MSGFTEDSTAVVILGLLAAVLLAFALVKTGDRRALWGLAGVGLALAACLAVERFVVTEREEVEALIEQGLAALRAHDVPAALELIDPDARQARVQARAELARVRFESLEITNATITCPGTRPPTATADLYVRFDVRGSGQAWASVARVKLFLHRPAERWRITGYATADPLQ